MNFFYYFVSFFLIINAIVFVHELGHYYAAKRIGVKVTVFSFGMGPEIFGFDDKDGTRWCFSLFPIGGYVMMLGDGDIASATEDEEAIAEISEEEKEKSFLAKTNWEKIFVAFAGPFSNYLYAFAVIVIMALSYGVPKYDTTIGSVLKDSPAEKAGFMIGDKILSVNGNKVEKYREILINISNNGDDDKKINFAVERGGKQISIDVTPKITEKKKLVGGVKRTKLVGIKSGEPVFERLSFIDAICRAFNDCISATKEMFYVLGHLFVGKKSLDDFGSVIHMASVAGDLSKSGNFALLIMFTVTLSLNLGFINLFPLPVLDGGKILISFIEEITNKKLNQKLQEYIMVACAILLILLMLVMTVNDILRIEAVNNFISNVLR